ncbi:SWF/SNF helicase family protein, partial [Pseudomonadota bacterium]|nr:SWF/SNF helicase family protein [Pseudomonadota bacterium]
YLERDKYNVEDIIKETFKDLDELVKFLAETRKFEPKNDDKLKKLIRLLKSKKFDQKKVIIFTEFADTARYIESQISKKDHNIEGVARIDGGSSGSRYDAVRQFAPYYNYTSSLDLKAENINEIRVLVATDVLSEGLNLQDCTLLVNYDIHWNPVRLLQRIGRVDRRINKEIEEKIIANHPEYSADRGKVSFYNFLPPNELERLVGIYNTVNKKALLISKTMGIEGQKLLTPEDEYQALKEFNVGYEGKTSLLENLHLDLQNLLKDIPELKDQLNNMPGAIFSGRALPKKGTKGVFFCFRLPGWDEDNADFLNGAGPCRWYLYDVSKKVILEEIADIIDSVKCKQETPRKISSKPETLKEIRDNIKKHIKNSYLKKIEAPLNDKNNNEISPKLIAWMEIS